MAHRSDRRSRPHGSIGAGRRVSACVLTAGFLVASGWLADAGDLPVTTDQPVWTLVPTHVDRTTDHRERLLAARDPSGEIKLSVDRPVRLGPDGSFAVGGKPTRIFGLLLPDRGKLCQLPGGPRWACGVRALATLSALLTERPLLCKPMSPPDAAVVVVSCKSGNDDVAARLIADGWADPAEGAGETLTALAASARQANRGQWRVALPGF